jgi:lipopolysaccharide/colanic/teichoic acid biosynthesis glycosyltransferase
MFKRAFDILFSTVGLILASPLYLVIAIVLVVADGFPVLFCQDRVGQHGRLFRIYKFRTMTVAKASNGFEPGQKSRVTSVGRMLRKTKLDELPQLWNVFVGDMSFVGPRPEVPDWVAAYPDRWAAVHTVRPGITDPAAIEYRNEEELLAAAQDAKLAYRDVILPRKLDMYEAYVRRRTFLGDLRILFQTIAVVVTR